jgi:dipeptidyl aminopeptidase/acylaminoacyl peptidase
MWMVDGDSVVVAPDNAGSASAPRRSDRLKLDISSDGRLSATDSGGKVWTLFPAIDPQVNAIRAPHYVQFQYVGGRGDSLFATALLPYDYRPGRRYPTVVYAYGGDVPQVPDHFAERNDDFLNLLLLAAHGYVVLHPSIPLDPPTSPSDPMLRLNDGVDPAIDSLVASGIADSTRLALLGHSYGGYTVYGLLTQTHRYKAAIAIAGVSDLVSYYGELADERKYTDPTTAALAGPWFDEISQLRMGVPPWIDPNRYVRNSPLLHVDQIHTPLLIIEGGRDDATHTQNEELFTALYRLGRRTEFVLYPFEGHAVESTGDLMDMWHRMFAWLDRYLTPTSP